MTYGSEEDWNHIWQGQYAQCNDEPIHEDYHGQF